MKKEIITVPLLVGVFGLAVAYFAFNKKAGTTIIVESTPVVVATSTVEGEETFTTTVETIGPQETISVDTGLVNIDIPVNALNTLDGLLADQNLKNSIEEFLFDESFTPIPEKYSFDGSIARIPTREGYTLVIDIVKGSIDIED